MDPVASALRFMPTNRGGNLSVFYDITAASNQDNFDSLYGTFDILSRAASIQWASLLESARCLVPAGLGRGAPAGVEAESSTEAPLWGLDVAAGRLGLGAPLAERVNLDLLVA